MSWIVRKLGIGKSEENIAKEVSHFLRELPHQGPFIVTPVCDGDKRHHSKRDFVKRVSQRHQKKKEGMAARYKSMSLEAEIEDALKAKGEVETEEHLKQQKAILTQSKYLED